MPWRMCSSTLWLQVLIPGLVVLFYKTYELLAMPSLASTYLITIIGIRLTPRAWASCDDRGDYLKAVKVFTKVAIVVHVYTVRPPPPPCLGTACFPDASPPTTAAGHGGRQHCVRLTACITAEAERPGRFQVRLRGTGGPGERPPDAHGRRRAT